MKKYLVPSIPNNLFRKSALIEQIDEAFEREANLVFIKAPSGYGKTYLMLDYAQHLSEVDGIAIWLNFNEEYDSNEDYFSSFIGVLTSANVLSSSFFYDENISLFKLVDAILDELESCRQIIYFFIDDFHQLKGTEVSDALKQFFLNNNPSIKILLTSRVELPFSTAKAYINDQIVKISHLELAFTCNEIKQYSDLFHLNSYSLVESETIVEQTGGWPALLSLNKKNINFDADYQELLFNKANSNLSEFLYQEIITNFTDEQNIQLSVLSVSQFLCEPLIQELLDDTNINLIGLEHIPLLQIDTPLLPPKFEWFIIQPLLREYLEFNFKNNDKNQYVHLHKKAANWYLSQEVYVEAVEHLIKAEQYVQAIGILENNGINIVASGNFIRFKRLIKKIPYKHVFSNVSLLILQGWYYTLNYQHSSAIAIAEQIKIMMAENDELKIALEFHLIGVEGAIDLFSDKFHLSIEKAEYALSKSPLNSEYMENSIRAQLAIFYLQTDQFSPFEKLKNEAHYFSKGGSLFFSTIYSFVAFAMKEFTQGKLDECLKICDETDIFIESWCNETRLGHIVKVVRGMVAYITGDLTLAKSLFETSGKIASYVSDPLLLAWYYPLHIRLLADLGLQVQQEELIDDIMSLANSRQISISKCPLIYEVMNCHFSVNHADDALAVFNQYKHELTLADYGDNFHLLSNEAMLHSLILNYEGQLEQQQTLLFDLAASYEASGRIIQQLNCLIPLINSAIASKNSSLAKQKLKKVVTIASSSNLIQMFAKLRPEALEFLTEWALSEWSPKRKLFMSEVCRRFSQESSDLPLSSFQIEPLTHSEKNVMELLALGYSNKVIAGKLDVSINTIKFHLKVIFSKLGVSNRIQANLVYSQNKGQFID